MSSHQEKIDAIIELEKPSSLVNHFLSNVCFSDQMIAEIKPYNYKLWRSDRWSRWMYSVFHITFNEEGSIVKIREELNPLGKYIKYLYVGFVLFVFASFIYDALLYPPDAFYSGHFIGPIALSVLFYGIYKAFAFGRTIEKNKMTDYYKIVIGLETAESLQQKKDLRSEWTGRKILTRLILYPLCIFLIFVGLYILLIDNGPKSVKSFGAGFFVLGLSLTYLIVDIKILIKKRK
jgi:hypothetical protein